ncbi:MAG: GNAT family N-acetyltransferase [Pseudomonadales bacterium]|jgi:GNAT superfamily N-acetyltransferase
MDANIRKGTVADLEAVCAVDAVAADDAARRERIARALRDSQISVLVVDGRIAGYGLLSRSFFGHPFIELVIIEHALRGGGLGPRLVEHLSDLAGPGKLFTSTNASNTHMQHVLTKLGFEQSGVIYNLDPGDPELVYFKAVRREGAQ